MKKKILIILSIILAAIIITIFLVLGIFLFRKISSLETSPVPTKVSETILYQSNFSSSIVLSDWQIAGSSDAKNKWKIANNSLIATNNNDQNTLAILKSGRNWTDYEVSTSFLINNPVEFGFLIRDLNPENYYEIRLIPDSNKNSAIIQLNKTQKGSMTNLLNTNIAYFLGQKNQVKIKIQQNTFNISINSKNISSPINDKKNSITNGSFGYFLQSRGSIHFYDLKINNLSLAQNKGQVLSEKNVLDEAGQLDIEINQLLKEIGAE
ncbi:MAG TPA: hypothetical protein VJJ80_03560 [Patescibacteria group bacterium]|nr:hypothetical protein [Patescibacteria group bacterium]